VSPPVADEAQADVAPSARRLPSDATVPHRPDSAPAPGAQLPSHYRWCFGCGADHETGLHLRMRAGEGLVVHGEFTVTEHHQGAPGLAHGGVLAAAFDEMLGAANWLLGHPVVTGRLECDFKRPVPVGAILRIDAEIVGVAGRKVYARATGRLEDDAVAVNAFALFVQVPLEHFRTHGNAEQVERAIADRARGGPAWRAGDRGVEVNP
jgi:acyl-coenzyme A thioesterase PaaI-like protein